MVGSLGLEPRRSTLMWVVLYTTELRAVMLNLESLVGHDPTIDGLNGGDTETRTL